MHYWNRDNFEGLERLASALEEDARFSSLAQYCRLRERGHRRQAFVALNSFLTSAETWDIPSSRAACQRILELHARTSEAHQFLSQPLLARFILPVLETWLAEEPTARPPIRWLGILRRDPVLLERALQLSPEDLPVRRSLVEWRLSNVDYATHHLVESRLIGDLDEVKETLADARAMAEAAPDPEDLADVLEEIARYEVLLRDWDSYSASPEGTFPEWCASRGRQHQWRAIVYYGE